MKKGKNEYFAITPPGLERVCQEEALALGLQDVQSSTGGVSFFGGIKDLYLANLYMRTASRILVRIGTLKATDFPELFRKGVRLPWGSFLRPETSVEIRVTAHRSRLMHTGRIEETLHAAIDRSLGRSLSCDEPATFTQLIFVRFVDDICTISCDSSGGLLHKRGYREDGGAAPLRETLAAASLLLLNWDGRIPLCDPLCGSGTIPIEGAMIATNQPPGRDRLFAFMCWPGYRHGLWQALVQEADRNLRPLATEIYGSDHDHQILEAARKNEQRANVSGSIKFSSCEIESLPVRESPGLVLCNPPYGLRLQSPTIISAFYKKMGRCFRRSFPGWKVAFIAPEESYIQATELALSLCARFSNGGISVALHVAEIPDSQPSDR